MVDQYQKLKDYFFSFIPYDEEQWLAQRGHLRIRKVPKNEFILQPKAVEQEIHFVNNGSFRVFNIVGEKEITTNFFFEGSYVLNFMSLITGEPSDEYIQALEDSEIISLPQKKMERLREKFPNCQKFGRLIAEKAFVSMYRRQQAFLFLTPQERYLQLLEKRPKVIERVPQHYIASYLGITPEYLSRLRRK